MNHTWCIKYIKDEKRIVFTFLAEDMKEAIKKWNDHTKGNIEISNIFSITNNTILMCCDKCIKHPPYNDIRGDGFCQKHKYRFYMGHLKKPCPKCAQEEGLCYECGEKI